MDSGGSQRFDVAKCCNCECSCSLIKDSYSGTWLRSVKRKFVEFEEGNGIIKPGVDFSSNARVEIENECDALREMVGSQQQSIQDLYLELEEERNAASSAANEAMSMILRLQREKAEVQMEARQFKRFVEEKIAHDQNEIWALQDLLYKREQSIQSLTCEVQAYKHRMMSFGLTEAEAEGEGEKGGHSRNQSNLESFDGQFEFPAYDYPPLRCNLNETLVLSEPDNEVVDVEKYAFGETPRDRDDLKNLEHRISQLEETPRSNHLDGDFNGTKNILEKVIVNHSPRGTRHSRRLSTGSSNALMGFAREMGPDFPADSPRLGSSFKKTEYVSHTEDYTKLRKPDNASETGDDASDRVYTIDSIHTAVQYNVVTEPKGVDGNVEDYLNTPKSSINRVDVGDPDIMKLYMRLQALEADRESMKQALISMRTDKAQLVLLREIAQQLCKEAPAEKRMPVTEGTVLQSFSILGVLKWILSLVFWRRRACQSKYTFGMSASNAGLLMLLDKGPCMRQWRCLKNTQTQV